MKYFTILFMCLQFSVGTSSSYTVSGKVVDSLTGLPLNLVLVRASSIPCSTYTDTGGKFNLAIPVVEVKIAQAPERPGLAWDPAKNSFSLAGFSGEVQLIDISGRNIAQTEFLPSGNYFVKIAGNIYQGLDVSGRLSFRLVPGKVYRPLAKTLAGVVIDFSKPDYKQFSQTVSGAASLAVKLPPLVIPSDSASVKLKVSLDSIGTVRASTQFLSKNRAVPR